MSSFGMEDYVFKKEEEQLLANIKAKYYMTPMIDGMHREVSKKGDDTTGWKRVLDNLHDVLINAKPEVGEILEERKRTGKINDLRQASKAIAGNAFQNLLKYTFLMNKKVSNIHPDLFITGRGGKNLPAAVIRVGDESQKPDADLFIYSRNKSGGVRKCMILSLKTSLRERAGQTYKWKLLLEIATTKNSIEREI